MTHSCICAVVAIIWLQTLLDCIWCTRASLTCTALLDVHQSAETMDKNNFCGLVQSTVCLEEGGCFPALQLAADNIRPSLHVRVLWVVFWVLRSMLTKSAWLASIIFVNFDTSSKESVKTLVHATVMSQVVDNRNVVFDGTLSRSIRSYRGYFAFY